ncbi:MAG: disulfide bond formation protein B [Pseudorhodoplanes sp.]
MTEITASRGAPRLLALLNDTYFLLMLLVIAGILTAAMILQYGFGELPCPLCLLQRVALFGVCFGIMQNFRHGFSYRNFGYSMLFTIFLLIVSVRQTLLDIYPRPGHEYIGSAVFGIHMPVWSIIIAAALLIAYAAQLAALGGEDFLRKAGTKASPVIDRLAASLSLYVIALCLINFVSVIVQCGFGECHTFNYKLLQ